MITEHHMVELEHAYEILAEAFARSSKPSGSETVALEHAQGRYLAESIHCRMDHPGFDQSAMDGVAIRWEQGKQTYSLKGVIAAGDKPDQNPLGQGEAVRIMTGAPMPAGADTVAMIEHVTINGRNCQLNQPAEKGQHIRFQGENLSRGDLLYPAGTRILPPVIAGLASQGVRFVKVKEKLRIGIATTGDEIISHHHPLLPGQIYNTNAPALAALLSKPAFSILPLGVLPDTYETTTQSIEHQQNLDVLLITGGVSMGAFDFVPKAAMAAGYEQLLHKVKMKPGKPVWMGLGSTGNWLFGLPGNPVSALVGCMLFVRPLLTALLNGSFEPPCWARLPLAQPVKNRSKFPFFQGATVSPGPQGGVVHAVKTSGSGDIVRFGTAQTLIQIPPQKELAAGELVQVLLSSQQVIG